MPENIIEQPEYIEFDVATINNVGSNIKVRNISIYKDDYDPPNDDKIKERLASELGYEGIGSYTVYVHDPALKVGDQMPEGAVQLHTVSIAVSSISTVMTSSIGKSDWIPVAAVDQQTTLSLESGDVTLTISEEALANHLDSWKGGYLNVNHEDNGEIDTLKIEDAKFEGGMLYHKVGPEVAEFIRNSASSGRSIEIQPLKIVDNKVIEFNGLGLSVLYPPFVPACGPDMGCSSDAKSSIKTIFSKLSQKVKSQSSINDEDPGKSPGEVVSGTDPNLEKTMNEDIEKLTSAKIKAEHGRDEARKEVDTLKSSLVEKDTKLAENNQTISDKDTLITEQTTKLKFYADAEAAAALKKKDEQWDVLKSSIPPGKFHKAEDEAALKQEFIEDPAGFSVKMVSWNREDPTGESGAEFTGIVPSTEEAADLKTISEFNARLGRGGS